MTFIDQRLELGLNYGATYGPRFNTAIATAANGIEQRRAIWSQPLITVQLGDRVVNQSELDYLLAFHTSVKGAFAGFRIRDWSDYKSGWTAIGTGNGTAQTWQLVKRYTVDVVTVTRPITKPIDGTLKVFLDGDEILTGWTCDYTTGVLSTELEGAIAVTFDFDVPVRFEQDKIDFKFEAGKGSRKLFTLAPLTCVELRIEPTIYPTLDVLPTQINEVFDLGYDWGTLGGPSYSTGIATNAAEFESRKSYWDNAKGSWDVGDRGLLRSELDYFIALFRCARGMAIPFNFQDWQDETTKLVRFAEDRISFRFDAFRSSDEEVIFNLGGVAIAESLPIPDPVCQPQTISFSDPLTTEWDIIESLSTGIYDGATYEVETSGGFWSVSIGYGNGIDADNSFIRWSEGWVYVPSHANESINLTFTADLALVSHNFLSPTNGYFVYILAIQNAKQVLVPLQIDSVLNSPWKTYSNSVNFGSFDVGMPILFTLFTNPDGRGDPTPSQIVFKAKNISLSVDVTCD